MSGLNWHQRLQFFCFTAFIVSSLFVGGVSGQAVPAAGTPASHAGEATGLPYQIELPVPLVIEDLVVLDGKGRPVSGLKASDFIVKENGKTVALRNFEEHIPHPAATLAATPQPLPSNTYTNVPGVPPAESLNILLFDALNTPLASQAFVRQQMLEYLKNMSPGTRIAIFGLGARLYLLQGFTDDPAVLRAAIEDKRGGVQLSPLLAAKSSQNPANPEFDSLMQMMMRNQAGRGGQMYTSLARSAAEEERASTQVRVIFTLQGMNELARYLSVLPGHKNLIWFSGSFPLNVLENEKLAALPNVPGSAESATADPYAFAADFRDDMRRTADLMARGRVAVYPVDARGIQADSSYNSSQYAVNRWQEYHNPVAADMASRTLTSDPAFAEQDTMNTIAAETGGVAFYNTNGLKDAVEKVTAYGESYYTLSYVPEDRKWNGAYRKIAIYNNSGRSDLRLYFRVGYFADDPNAQRDGKRVLPLNAMQTAMLHGVPEALQVQFKARVIPAEKPELQLTSGGAPDPKLMKPPYRNYQIQYFLDIRTVRFIEDASKMHHATLELASLIYDADGNPVNSTVSRVNLDLPDDKFAQILQHGVLTRQTIDAPDKGDYFLRVGVHDLNSDNVGALEIPLAKLMSYQELQAEAEKQGDVSNLR
jgi:VWFA-related protein